MMPIACNIIFGLFLLASVPISWGAEEDDGQEIQFQWLATSKETSGVRYLTQRLQSLSPRSVMGSPVEIEEEEIEVDSRTTRKMRRVYATSPNGKRVLIESVEEEIQRLPGDRTHAVRTTSRRDINGRLNPAQREVQEVTPTGNDSFHVTRTLLMPESGGGFVERERIQQTERRKGDTNVEIERIRYEADANGKWSATERRVSRNILDGDVTRTNEQVYQSDANNRMALTERLEVTEWRNAGGQMHRRAESYTLNLDGKLQLRGRTTIIQRASEDGGQETTEIIERTNSAEPGGGLKPVHRIVEKLQNLSQNETVRQLEVMEPDLNGRWQSLHSEQSVERK